MRPKLRQKASTTHLKMLHQRKDVSSTIDTTDEDSSKQLDPNSYSTYMGKQWSCEGGGVCVFVCVFVRGVMYVCL